jgi:hypothetical protein
MHPSVKTVFSNQKTLISMKKLIFLCLTINFSACKTEMPLFKTQPKNNGTYTVEYLFEHDGCKVYRFRDNGQYVYFTNCKGETIVPQDSLPAIRNSTIIKKQ